MTTGSYPNVLDHLYTHHYILKDSIINHLMHENIKSVLFGNAKNWEELFPKYFNSTNVLKADQITHVLEQVDFNHIRFGIGEYIYKDELLVDLQDMLDNLDYAKR